MLKTLSLFKKASPSPAKFFSSTFDSLKLHSYLQSSLQSLNYSQLTTIQSKSLPLLLNKSNCLLLSETGTGKTLCYLLPIIQQILAEKDSPSNEASSIINKRRGAIILTPSKELCVQIYSEARRLDKENRINFFRAGPLTYKSPVVKFLSDVALKTKKPAEVPSTVLERIGNQNVLNSLNWSRVDCLINTPTHLEALLRMKLQKNPNEIKPKIIVLDEVDLLLGDPFFAHSTKYLIDQLADPSVQIILSGASLMYKINGKPSIEVLSSMFKDLMIVETANFHRFPQEIKHQVVRIENELEKNPEKNAKILMFELVENLKFDRLLVFCNSGETAEELHMALGKNNLASGVFYSTLHKDQKAITISRFRTGDIDILVTTDLAARGLDFKDVHHIIQFDFPKDILTLLHRFGRTARLGQKGHVISFITKKDEHLLEQFNKLQERNEKLELIFKGNEPKKGVNQTINNEQG